MPRTRRNYRSALDRCEQLQVSMRLGGTAQRAEPIDISSGGICLALPDDAIATPALGDIVELRLRATDMPAPIPTAAAIVRVEHEDGWVVLGLQFLDWIGLVDGAPEQLAQLLNRRLAPRLPIDQRRAVAVSVRDLDETFEQHGILLDVSSCGISIGAELTAQRALAHVDDVVVAFALPGVDEPFTFRGVIRQRCWDGESLRYGICFEPDGTKGHELQVGTIRTYVEERLEAGIEQLSRA